MEYPYAVLIYPNDIVLEIDKDEFALFLSAMNSGKQYANIRGKPQRTNPTNILDYADYMISKGNHKCSHNFWHAKGETCYHSQSNNSVIIGEWGSYINRQTKDAKQAMLRGIKRTNPEMYESITNNNNNFDKYIPRYKRENKKGWIDGRWTRENVTASL